MNNSPSLKNQKRVRVVSLFPNVGNHETAIREIAALVKRGTGGYVCFSTVHMVMESYDNEAFAAKVNGADYIITDGMPLVWMQKFQGAKNAARVRANDLMIMLCRFAKENNLRVGFFGGKPEVINTILVKTKIEYPQLAVAYAYSPPFRALTEAEDAQITAEINAAQVDILFMGLGCPKQENWMAAHKNNLTAVMLGVGASFDFFAGNVKECPPWLGKFGLEWLFRLTQEPKRLWRRYLILNPRFMWLAVKQLISKSDFRRKIIK